MTACWECGSTGVTAKILPEFSIADLVGAPFPVILEDVVEEKACAKCGQVIGHVIPQPDQMAAIVAILRACDPMKLNGKEIRFLRKTMSLKAKALAAKMALTADHLSRYENDKALISENYERLLRALVCLAHVKSAQHIDLDLGEIVNMKIVPARDVDKNCGFRLVLTDTAPTPAPSNTIWKSHAA